MKRKAEKNHQINPIRMAGLMYERHGDKAVDLVAPMTGDDVFNERNELVRKNYSKWYWREVHAHLKKFEKSKAS